MNDTPPDLILLKGAPGVGKSTAAKILARHFAKSVRIEVDALRTMVTNVDWTNQTEHRSVLSLSAQLAAGFLRSGFAPVILVDTFSGDKIDGFLAGIRSECPAVRVFVVILHATDEILSRRVLHRSGEEFRDVEIALRINHKSVRDAQSFERLIDTSEFSPDDAAEAILGAIRGHPHT